MSTVVLERPLITITNIIWSFDHATQLVKVFLIKRSNQPFKDYCALPETQLRLNESAHEASLRLVKEKLGLSLSEIHAEQLATFTAADRDPSARSLSLSYMVFLPQLPDSGPGASDVRWFTLSNADGTFTFQNGHHCFKTLADNEYLTSMDKTIRLAFDHNWILTVACHRIVNKLDYQPSILLTLGADFTLKQARCIYNQFGQNEYDNSNFLQNHKKLLRRVGQAAGGHPGRPAAKFRLNL